MGYDESVAKRVRNAMRRRKGMTEQKMFGGIAFMIEGHMCCGVLEKQLVLRLGDEKAAEALQHKHTKPMDFTGRPMKSMVYVLPKGFSSDEDLKTWINSAVSFVRPLPPKN